MGRVEINGKQAYPFVLLFIKPPLTIQWWDWCWEYNSTYDRAPAFVLSQFTSQQDSIWKMKPDDLRASAGQRGQQQPQGKNNMVLGQLCSLL